MNQTEGTWDAAIRKIVWGVPIAEKYEIGFLDAGEYAASSKLDGVHLDDANQQKLGEAVANYIRKQAVK